MPSDEVYWATRKALNDRFAIQFISTDPNIPWEMMRPITDDDQVETEILALPHPVAQCIGDSNGSLRHHLPQGKIATHRAKVQIGERSVGAGAKRDDDAPEPVCGSAGGWNARGLSAKA